MRLKYRKVDLLISFKRYVTFSIPPVFILRTVLGKELHHLVCLFRDRRCTDCSLKHTCAYSWIFETLIDKNTAALAGRDRASHPFLLSTHANLGDRTKNLTATLTLIGKGIDYLPYLYYALVRAGKAGIFKERIPFDITDILSEGKSILLGENGIDTERGIKIWDSHLEESGFSGRKRISILTPLRLKIHGEYVLDFQFEDLLHALQRRVDILTSLFGEDAGTVLQPCHSTEVRIFAKNLKWVDLDYYSSRQRELLKFGGLVGEIETEGRFSGKELALLRFGELFHIGKNAAFGLGKIRVEGIGG